MLTLVAELWYQQNVRLLLYHPYILSHIIGSYIQIQPLYIQDLSDSVKISNKILEELHSRVQNISFDPELKASGDIKTIDKV